MAGLMDFLQSASNSAASNVSAPVDGLAWLLRKAGVQVPSNPLLGSDWMAEKGLTKPVAQSAAGLLGETAGMLSPMLAAAKAPQIAKGLLQGMDNLAAPQVMVKQAGAINTQALADQFPGVKFDLGQTGKNATLSRVVVPAEQRGQGVGSDFMQSLVKAADADGATLALSPSADFGGNKNRLVDFYKRFGFEPNKGRNIDFEISESMRRYPDASAQVAKPFVYPQDKALATAQANAAKSLDEGGLGLSANNTPAQRAQAMGFDEPMFKGMYPYDYTKEVGSYKGPEISSINRTEPFPSFGGADGDVSGVAGFMSNNPTVANRFSGKNGAVYPLSYKKSNEFVIDANGGKAGPTQFGDTGLEFRDAIRSGKYETIGIKNTADEGDITVALNPANIRSRFAAFDPARRNEADLLGKADPALLGLIGAGVGGGAAYYNSDR